MGAGEAFVIEDTAADTNISHTVEADRGLAGTPLLQQGDWSGQWSSPELTIPTGVADQPFLLGFSQLLRSSGTARSGAVTVFSVNTGAGHANLGVEGVGKTGYNRLSGGADEATHHMVHLGHYDADDDIKVRQGAIVNATNTAGDYDRTLGDPRGFWAVQFPDNDFLYASISATDVGSGYYGNTPRPIALGTPSALTGGTWKQVTFDNTDDSSGSAISRTGGVFTLAANSKFLLVFIGQFAGASDRNSTLVQVQKDGSPYCYSSAYMRGSGYSNDRAPVIIVVPMVTGGSTEEVEILFVDQVEEATNGEMDCVAASLRIIDLSDADMCILGKTDADITDIGNTWTDFAFPTADEIVDDTSFDHDGTNTERINNNAGETITVLAGGVGQWDKSLATNGTRVTPGHRLARSATGLDYAIWDEYARGAQSGDDQFIAGSSFCAPVELTSAQYITLQYQDTSQQGGGDALVLNATDDAAVLFWAIRIDDLGGPASNTINMSAATLVSSAQALTPVGGAITVPMSEASLTASPQSLSVSAIIPPQTVSLSTATLVSSPQGLSVIPGAVQIEMQEATLVSSTESASVVAGAVQVAMQSVTLASASQGLSVVAGGVQIGMQTVTLTGTAQSATLIAGAVQVTMQDVSLVSSPQALTITTAPPITVSMGVVTLASSVQSLTAIPGTVVLTMSAVTLTASPQAFVLVALGAPQIVALDSVDLASSPQTLTVVVVGGPQTVSLGAITLASSAGQMIVQPGGVIALMQAVTLASSIQGIRITIGATVVQMQAVSLVATLPLFDILPGSTTIQMGSVALILSPQTLRAVFLATVLFEHDLEGSRTYDTTIRGSI